MRNKILITALCLSILGLLYACHKELSQPDSEITDPNIELDVNLAKKYYKSLKSARGDLAKRKTGASTSSDRPNRKFLMFKKAYESSTKTSTFVEVPLYYNQKVSAVLTKGSNRNIQDEKAIFNGSFDRVVFYKNKISGRINQRIVSFVPDIEYLRKKGMILAIII